MLHMQLQITARGKGAGATAQKALKGDWRRWWLSLGRRGLGGDDRVALVQMLSDVHEANRCLCDHVVIAAVLYC